MDLLLPSVLLLFCVLLITFTAYIDNNGMNSVWKSSLVTTIRLHPEADLKQSILQFTKLHKISSGSIITAVGSLNSVKFRLASASPNNPSEVFTESTRKYEIVSLVGTTEFDKDTDNAYGHFHISVADEKGMVFGGHLLDGCFVYTTVEITIAAVPSLQNVRLPDQSGYKELVVRDLSVIDIKHSIKIIFQKMLQLVRTF
jgi:uncharacterized protein